MVEPASMLAFNGALSPVIYFAPDGNKQLSQLSRDGTVVMNTIDYFIRDICTFNGELIVVEQHGSVDTTVHRYKADGKTEITPALHVPGTVNACTSDGTSLYLSRWDGPFTNEIVVASADEVKAGALKATPTAVDVPAAIKDNCPDCDRLLDLVYVPQRKLFLGLFAAGMNGGVDDVALDSQYVTMFALDGGVTPPLDMGNYHGIGEFNP
jgi:hypothetical protein